MANSSEQLLSNLVSTIQDHLDEKKSQRSLKNNTKMMKQILKTKTNRFVKAKMYTKEQISIKIDKKFCQIVIYGTTAPENFNLKIEDSSKLPMNSDQEKNEKRIRPKNYRHNIRAFEERVHLPFWIKNQDLFEKIDVKFYKNHGLIIEFPENPKSSSQNQNSEKVATEEPEQKVVIIEDVTEVFDSAEKMDFVIV